MRPTLTLLTLLALTGCSAVLCPPPGDLTEDLEAQRMRVEELWEFVAEAQSLGVGTPDELEDFQTALKNWSEAAAGLSALERSLDGRCFDFDDLRDVGTFWLACDVKGVDSFEEFPCTTLGALGWAKQRSAPPETLSAIELL